jgi:hypothetical protein
MADLTATITTYLGVRIYRNRFGWCGGFGAPPPKPYPRALLT